MIKLGGLYQQVLGINLPQRISKELIFTMKYHLTDNLHLSNISPSGDILFVCLGLTSLLNICGHIATVPARSSGTLTNMLPHRNVMPQTQDTTTHPVTVYRRMADLSLCYPLMWNVTLEHTATHFNILGKTRPGNPSPTFHTH